MKFSIKSGNVKRSPVTPQKTCGGGVGVSREADCCTEKRLAASGYKHASVRPCVFCRSTLLRVCHSESAHESQTFFGAADIPPERLPTPPQIFTSFCCISNPIVLLLVSNKGVRYFRASFFIIKVYFDINQ